MQESDNAPRRALRLYADGFQHNVGRTEWLSPDSPANDLFHPLKTQVQRLIICRGNYKPTKLVVTDSALFLATHYFKVYEASI